ncbi:Cilia- and flagella-associated protein 54 [Saguinus oedipus]|uniref:Cilia- and flagella-associated protein 54 n=1 Tax=Saguinus oedipus TaxID=9490 RepID=A0ABQ9V062_SAGOE|nr:Cilia- and flagella-associated protein 54 [Saguinus oedipus]
MEAEDRLNFLLSEVEHPGLKTLSQCSAGELEIVVEARLQLAAVALQRHRAAYRRIPLTCFPKVPFPNDDEDGVRTTRDHVHPLYPLKGAAVWARKEEKSGSMDTDEAEVFSTLTLLQDSKLFQKKVVQEDTENPVSPGTSDTENKDDNEFLDPISLNAREYFNIHLWLRCRLALVTAFVAQIHGIGIVKEDDMTDCLSLINEVYTEAKSAGDTELQAELLTQAVILGLQEKHLKADIITKLQADLIGLLNSFQLADLMRAILLGDEKRNKTKHTKQVTTVMLNRKKITAYKCLQVVLGTT